MDELKTPARFAESMDAFLDEYCRLFTFSGILRVTHRDSIIYERCIGYADPENLVPISPESVFTLYSLSKPFCAIAFLLLCDRGLADLDAHPGKYVPEAAGFDSRVTFRQLLTHTSGLPDFSFFPEIYDRKPFDIRTAVRELAAKPLVFAPGEGGLYANINFALPALAVENISGVPYAEYMREQVFAPLGMEHAQIDRNHLLIPNRVRGFELDGDGLCSVDRNLGPMFGSGDAVGDINDVYCLNKAIKEKKLLRPETWATALTPSPINSYGMGCGVTEWHGKRRINHSGGHKGFRTLHVQLPEEDFDIILLSNCGFGDARNAISEAVYTAFFGADENVGKQIDMDAGYIPSVTSARNEDFLPKRLGRIEFDKSIEDKLLGDYEGMKLLKDGENYCMLIDGWQHIICYGAAPNLLAGLYSDEIYGIDFDSDGEIVSIHGRKKLR